MTINPPAAQGRVFPGSTCILSSSCAISAAVPISLGHSALFPQPQTPHSPQASSAEDGTWRVSLAFRGGFVCLSSDLWVGGFQPHLTALLLCARWVIPRGTHPFSTFFGPLMGWLPSPSVQRQQCSGWLWLQGMSRREGINIHKERENECSSSRCAKGKGETSKALDPCRELHNGNVHS